MTVREACIVAGGAGTRLRPLTATTPKPLLPFGGRPFLTGVLARLADVGVERVLLVVGADPSPFEVLRPDAVLLVVGADPSPFEVLRPDADRLGIALEAVPEPEPLDTAGGVRAALASLTGTVLVLNGDILTDVPLDVVLAHHGATGAAATLVLTRVEDTSTFGVCVRDGTRIVDFVEKPAPGSLPGQDAINAGTYVLEPSVLAAFPEGRLSFERQVFPGLVAAGERVEGVVSDAVWADLGTPERYLAGHRLALDGALRWPAVTEVPDAGDGVRVEAGADVDPAARLIGPVLVRAGATVAADAIVGPHVTLGVGSRVGARAIVVDSVLYERSSVGDDVRAERLLAGTGASVGSGTVLGRDVVIGDGVTIDPGGSVPDGGRVPDGA